MAPPQLLSLLHQPGLEQGIFQVYSCYGDTEGSPGPDPSPIGCVETECLCPQAAALWPLCSGCLQPELRRGKCGSSF